MRVCGMRRGIKVDVTATDRQQLAAIVADRNSPQKHVWRAQIVLLTADGCGTAEIMRRTDTSETAVWRWQICHLCRRTGTDPAGRRSVGRVMPVPRPAPHQLRCSSRQFPDLPDPGAQLLDPARAKE